MGNINTELLAKIRDRILAVPEAYDQEVWGVLEESAPCGTACCIAGHALIIAGRYTPEEVGNQATQAGAEIDFHTEAANLLGLADDDAEILFTGNPEWDWPEVFAERWHEVNHADDVIAAHARVAAAYLDHIIKTGSVTEAGPAR